MNRTSGRRSPARAIHLNPVSVSRNDTPASAAIADSSVEETMVVAASLEPPRSAVHRSWAAPRWMAAAGGLGFAGR